MTATLTVLSAKHHNRLRFEHKNDFSFAKNEHNCPLMVSEVYAASFSFPVVFPASGDTIVPQAMLSAIPKTNNCVGEDGTWQGGYLPLHFRRYPFFVGRETKSDQSAVLFDETAPQLSETDGKPLYIQDGETFTPSPLLEEIKESLVRFDQEYQKTKALGKLLSNAKVLTPAKVTVQSGGKKTKIAGFSVVDWNKVSKLDDATLANWSRIGLLQLIHSHLQSLKKHGLDSSKSTYADPDKEEKSNKKDSKEKKAKKK